MNEKNMAKKFDARDYFKRWPVFYYLVMIVFGPAFFTGLTSKKFLQKYPHKGTILNLGSGPRIIGPAVTNVDIYPYEGVSIVADISSVPLPPA